MTDRRVTHARKFAAFGECGCAQCDDIRAAARAKAATAERLAEQQFEMEQLEAQSLQNDEVFIKRVLLLVIVVCVLALVLIGRAPHG